MIPLWQHRPRARAWLLIAPLAIGCSDDPSEPELTPPTVAPTFAFTSLEAPAARATTVFGINSNGDRVGSFVDATGITRGFLMRGDSFIAITYPDAGRTIARGINDAGEIVGNWARPGDAGVISFGFRRSPTGQLQPITFAGYKHVIPQRILGDGTILGCAHQDDLMASMIGITTGTRVSTTTTFASMHNGATPDLKRIVGLYTKMPEDRQEGYIIENGVLKPLVPPGGTLAANAWDINPRGESVGWFQDAAGVHGFIHASTYGYVTIDYPGATVTRAFGINGNGDVVGAYVAGGVTRGFLARRTR